MIIVNKLLRNDIIKVNMPFVVNHSLKSICKQTGKKVASLCYLIYVYTSIETNE